MIVQECHPRCNVSVITPDSPSPRRSRVCTVPHDLAAARRPPPPSTSRVLWATSWTPVHSSPRRRGALSRAAPSFGVRPACAASVPRHWGGPSPVRCLSSARVGGVPAGHGWREAAFSSCSLGAFVTCSYSVGLGASARPSVGRGLAWAIFGRRPAAGGARGPACSPRLTAGTELSFAACSCLCLLLFPFAAPLVAGPPRARPL